MENHGQHEIHKTPPRFLENFSLDIREAMQRRNGTQSPFACIPNISTPPSQFFKIKNPFENALIEKLHSHIFSPSVFAEVKRSSEKFKWSIDELSSLTPAHIDVSTVHNQIEHNSEDEGHVQAKIEKYFSEMHTVPSPWNENIIKPLVPVDVSPCATEPSKEVCDGWTQTVLTLPPILPKEVEQVLKPYFNFTQEQDERNTSLCRRLFNIHEESVSSEHDSDASAHSDVSLIGSPVNVSCKLTGRNFDSSPCNSPSPNEISPISNSTPHRLSSCQISPITSRVIDVLRSSNDVNVDDSLSPISRHIIRKTKSISRLDFSGHMSVDTSFNMAPENDLHDLHNKTNTSESPLRTNEYMENSCNWDMEYNNLSLNGRSIRKNLFTTDKRSSSESVDIHMDISSIHHQTPKSNKTFSQRKKLSDSFKLFDSDSESDTEDYNQLKQMRYNINDDCKSNVKDLDILSQNTQDTGYNTCSELSQRDTRHEDEMITSDISSFENKENAWNMNIIASTPTKNLFREFNYQCVNE